MQLKLTILSIYLTNMLAGSMVVPMLPGVSKAFNDSNGETFAMFFLIIPSLVVIPVLLLAPFLSKIIVMKNQMIAGMGLFFISGIGSMFAFTEGLLLFFRALSGVASGLVLPYALTLIINNFNNDERTKMIGYSGVVTYIGAVVLLFISGSLAQLYWRFGMLVYLVALIPLYLIKKNIKDVPMTQQRKHPLKFQLAFKPSVYKIWIIYFLSVFGTYVYFINIPFLIVDSKIGGAYEIGFSQGVMLIAGTLSNFFMPIVKKKSRDILFLLQYMFIAFGMLMLGSTELSIYDVYLGSFLFGLGYGSIGSSTSTLISENTSKINRVTAFSIMSIIMYLSQFVSALTINKIDRMFNKISYNNVFIAEGLLFSVVSAILMVELLRKRHKEE